MLKKESDHIHIKKTKAERTTISLSDTELKKLRELAKKEHRPISRQIIHMMEFYKKQIE